MTKITGTLSSVHPASGYLLIQADEATKQTSSGIYLPDSSGDKPQQGTTLAVGSDEITEKGSLRKSPVKKGDKVIYKKWGGNEVKIDGKEYLFVKFEDVLAVIS